jgi:hypothetical protein
LETLGKMLPGKIFYLYITGMIIFLQLFNWFQLFSTEQNQKVAGYGDRAASFWCRLASSASNVSCKGELPDILRVPPAPAPWLVRASLKIQKIKVYYIIDFVLFSLLKFRLECIPIIHHNLSSTEQNQKVAGYGDNMPKMKGGVDGFSHFS